MRESDPPKSSAGERTTLTDLRATWPAMSGQDRIEGFFLLPQGHARQLYLSLDPHTQGEILRELPEPERTQWLKLLPPDDIADVCQAILPEEGPPLLKLLDPKTREEVETLMQYSAQAAGGIMSPRFAHLPKHVTVDEALRRLRRQATEHAETIYYVYVLENDGRLVGVCSFREIFIARGSARITEIMHTDLIVSSEQVDQEAVARLFEAHDLIALPVVTADGIMKGVITVDDIMDVVEEEATEDAQKFGGMEALDLPYTDTGFLSMLKKRGGWLSILFLGEMLTATAMAVYENEIASAVVLAVFVPLIISSGGNSGSQASTLIIRAMALGEVRLTDWWRIAGREVTAGLALGGLLAVIGAVRILTWQGLFGSYGEHYILIMLTVSISLVGVVVWGTLSGSMLPFILRKAGFDPASASAPFVATLVDVCGLLIYFNVAKFFLTGVLLD